MLSIANWQTDTLTIAPGDSVIQLSKKIIFPETLILNSDNLDSISTDGIQVDAMNGILHGMIGNADTLTVYARYEYCHVKLPRQQILNSPPRIYIPPAPDSNKETTAVSAQKSAQIRDYDFLKSGTIYRGVSLQSNSGMSLQSGLNLELQGNISEDITIVGTLSDQNIPIQPEGNTQTIEEIDKVFIQVRMPYESITFGDYEFSNRSATLSNYQRKLQGVLIESDRPNYRTQLSGAVTKGQYTGNYFNGEEANQGPYQLVGKEGETAIIVLAGTEKVWINSEPMRRGENSDYVIDYSTGEITFTPHRLITSDSRISVDFQYSNLIYQKNIWIARNTTALAEGKLKLTAGMISETDDKDNPIELTLSDTDITHLKQLGDNVDDAFQSTIIEDSAGVYYFDTIDSILVFMGSGGTHSASFHNVGEKGSYRKVYTADSYYFEYVDKTDPTVPESKIEEAVYLPVKPLKLPTSQRLYHFSGQWQPSKNVSVTSELAGSDFDRNTFSNLEDDNNRDLALSINTDIEIPLTERSKAGVKLNYRKIGERFEPIDRIQEVEYRRKWDLSSDSTQGEQVMEAGLNLNLNEVVNLNLDLGSYNRNSIDANRYKISSSLQYKWIDRLELSQERVQRSLSAGSSDWLRQRFLFRLNVKDVKPFTEIYSEERTGGRGNFSNFQFLEQRYGVEVNGSRKFSGRIETYFRDDKDLENGNWVQSSSSQNFAFSGQMNDWKTLSSRFSYTYRLKEYSNVGASPNQEVQLMDVMLKQQPRKLPYSWETTMKIEEERTVKKEFQYYYVGEGEGQYAYDSTYSDYVPHPNGDYILRIIPSQIKEPVTSIRNGLRLQLNGRRLRGKIPWEFPTRLTALTDIRLQQQIRSNDNPLRILAIDEANIDDRWAFFNRTFQQDVLYYFEQRKSNLRFRYLDNNTISQLDVRGPENSIVRETSLRYKGDFIGKLRLESEFASKYTFRESEFNALRNRDIRAYRLENTFSYLWNIVHLFECEIKSSYDLDQSEDAIEALLLGIRNSYERKVQNKGCWKAFLEIDRVAITPEGSPIPWEMSGGRKEGNTYGWGVSAEYRIGRNLSLRLNYEGWNEPDRDVYHLGGGEIRALF
ncbi:MAG: hypothetical protein ABIK30_08020 [bacterium]